MAFNMSETTLGAELKKRRGTTGLRAMSRETGIPVSTLSRLEHDETDYPTKDLLARVSIGYGIPLETLAQLVYCGRAAAMQLEPAL